MKGGDVIIVEALRALKAAGVLDRLSITVVMHGDEEDAGAPLDSARATLTEAAKRSQVALGFEDGSGDPHTAVISRRSAGSWTLRTTGTPGHSSQIFRDDIGAGALYEASRILDGFRTRLGGQQYLTINPGRGARWFRGEVRHRAERRHRVREDERDRRAGDRER